MVGGYGTFGTFICERLVNNSDVTSQIELLVAGRSLNKSQDFAKVLSKKGGNVNGIAIDINDKDFKEQLAKIQGRI